MKYLLNGVAIAAALAITAPAWAQGAPPAPASPPKPMAAPAAPATPMAAKPTSGKPMATRHHGMHHAMHHRMGSMTNQGDKMTEQLNQQELARITGGGAPAAPPPPPPQGGSMGSMPANGMGQQPGK